MYCYNSVVLYFDRNGEEPENCNAPYFKDVYYLTADEFDLFISWLCERHPNKAPNPPILDVIGADIETIAEDVIVKSSGKLSPVVGGFFSYIKGIFDIRSKYEYRCEEYVLDELLYSTRGSYGRRAVRVELLHGRATAEIRLTLLTTDNNIIKLDAISMRDFGLIFKFTDKLYELSKGRLYHHEHVDWQYSMLPHRF